MVTTATKTKETKGIATTTIVIKNKADKVVDITTRTMMIITTSDSVKEMIATNNSANGTILTQDGMIVRAEDKICLMDLMIMVDKATKEENPTNTVRARAAKTDGMIRMTIILEEIPIAGTTDNAVAVAPGLMKMNNADMAEACTKMTAMEGSKTAAGKASTKMNAMMTIKIATAVPDSGVAMSAEPIAGMIGAKTEIRNTEITSRAGAMTRQVMARIRVRETTREITEARTKVVRMSKI